MNQANVKSSLFVLAAVAASCNAQYTWQAAPSFNGGARVWAAGAQLPDGTVLAMGGTPFEGAAQNGSVQRLQGGVWHSYPALDGPIQCIGAGIDAAGRIVVFSGMDPVNGDRGAARTYDLVEGLTGEIAQRDESWPHHLTASAVDGQGRLFCMGGTTGGTAASAHADRYDSSLDAWSTLAPMPSPVLDAAAVYDGQGHVLVIGGEGSSGLTANVARYDIATNSWSDSAVGDLPTPTSGLRAVLGADGRVYAMGGRLSLAGVLTIVADVWVLDLASNTWTQGPSMAAPRAHFGAILDVPNSRILVLGGENDSGGTNTCETLFTPTCPSFSGTGSSVLAWVGGGLALSAPAGGGAPMTFQWQRDGVALVDGPALDGSVVNGADAATLRITGVTPQSAGVYQCVATNPCGLTASAPRSVTTRVLSAGAWSSVDLDLGHPWGSWASGVSGSTQVGGANVPSLHPNYTYLSGAIEWHDTAAGSVVYAPNSVGGAFHRVHGDLKVGWWWKPYQVYVSGQWQTAYYQSACVFNANGFFDRAVPGHEYSQAYCTDGITVGGSASFDDNSGNYYYSAVYWDGPNASSIHYLNPPAGMSATGVFAVDGQEKYGSAHGSGVNFNGYHAVKWTTSDNPVEVMTPAGATSSGISDAGQGQQVGSIGVGQHSHACVWSGSAASAVDLHPSGATASGLAATDEGLQVGVVDGRASLWMGSPQIAVDLHAILPAGYATSSANDIHVDAIGVIRVVGSATLTTGGTHAMLWTFQPGTGPACDSVDFNRDLLFPDTLDIDDFLSVFSGGECSNDPACGDIDFNNDGLFPDTMDIDALLSIFSGGPCIL